MIVETPAGSRNKFVFDPDQSVFPVLKNVLPPGWFFLMILDFCRTRSLLMDIGSMPVLWMNRFSLAAA